MKTIRITAILVLLLLYQFGMAQNVVRMEYFFDSDPGYGNGQSLSLSSGSAVLHSGNISCTSLSDGIHIFYSRAKQNSIWGQTHSQLVGISSSANISQGEYYFDNDPGYGNGTAFNTTNGSLVSIQLSPDISSLSDGIHVLHMRVFNGVWSQTFTKIIGTYNGTSINALEGEYFYDTDPGHGNGISFGNLNSSGTKSFSPSISGLSKGIHTLYFRVNSGSWSQTVAKQVLIMDASNTPIGFEYFFDSDPGFGQGTSIAATQVSNGLYTLTTNIPLTSLSDGIHALTIRPATGVYGQSFSKIVAVTNNSGNQNVSGEYFFDTDPGYGNGTSVNASSGVFQFSPSLSALTSGIHTLYFRSNSGSYGQTFSKTVFVNDESGIQALEYFVDTDPGFGQGTPISFSGNSNVVTVNTTLDLNALSTGYHTLGIRAKSGSWSQTFYKQVYVSENSDITYAEYFFNTDPGNGNGESVAVTSDKLVDLNISPDISNLTLGYNQLFVRVKSSNNFWSIVHTDSVCISAVANFTFDTVCLSSAMSFQDLSTDSDGSTSFKWDMGSDGTIDYTGTNNIQHTFLSAGYHNVSLIAQQSDGCADTIQKQVLVKANLIPSVSIAASTTTICSGTSVTFTATPTNGGSTPVYLWKLNGTGVGTNSSTYTSTTLVNMDVVSLEMTTSETCVSTSSATSNSISMTVSQQLTPSVSIAASTTSICSGSSVTFTATSTNGGSSPLYLWKLNGTGVGTNSSAYTSTTLSNSDVISLEMTSSETCVSASSATSNSISMTVSQQLTPSVSITASATTICSGTSVTFTATPTNGGSTPVYLWKLNGTTIGTNSSTYTSTTIANADVVSLEMTTSETCVTSVTASSNNINMVVSTQLTPVVSIAASATSICPGSSVTFTATPTNGGSSPVYLWKLNGSTVGTNSSTYSSTTLLNADVVSLEMTTSETCVTSNTASSNSISMTVLSQLTPSVSIAATATTICSGTTVTFTATPTNGGSSPVYLWKLNGTGVGSNSSTYISTTLSNSDVISLEMTSSETCVTSTTASSNSISMTVSQQLTPSVSIAASTTSICSGSSVTFTATSTNGGSSPLYLWKLNGTGVGTNSSAYTSTTLSNSDVISLEMTSSETCVSASSATSNSISMTVSQQLTPSVSIAASTTSICSGASVTFTATPTNGGSSPVYLWKLNGTGVGTNSSTYTSTTLSNADVVSLEMTSSETCVTSSTATSNTITISVNSILTPSVSIVATSSNICAGSAVTFTATPVHGGSTPSYTWLINGTPAGMNSPTFTSTTLANAAMVRVRMASSASCAPTGYVHSNSIGMLVSQQLTPSVSIVATDTTICGGTTVTFTATPTNGGSTPVYQWKLNGADIGTNSSTFISSTLVDSDTVSVEMTSSEACVSVNTVSSTNIIMSVVSQLIPSVGIVATDTTICIGTTVTFTATPTNGGVTPIYQWKLNGIDVGTNSSTFISSTLADSDTVSVDMTSSEACVSMSTVTSTNIIMLVASQLTPSVSLVATDTTICMGTTVTFTATATNGGSTPIYQWKLNGTNVGTNSPTFISSTLADSDTITVEMTSSESCVSISTVSSTNIIISLVTQLIASVGITATDTTICNGTTVTFTATPIVGGTVPVYQWKLNGANVGTNSPTYISSTLVDLDTISVEMTSSESCVSISTVSSTNIIMSLVTQLVASVGIIATDTTICNGTSVAFTATPIVGGAAPVYQWKLNGTNVGTNSPTFISSTLVDLDTISVEMTSSESCVSMSTVNSTSIIMSVVTQLTPSIIVIANDTTICSGSAVTFTATPSNEGLAPVYQWKLNGMNVGTNSPTYISSTLVDLDTISVEMTSSESCVSMSTVSSTNIIMSVVTQLVASVGITATDTTICNGTTVTFTATPIVGGTVPVYQWKLNGANVGTNSPTFVSSTLVDSDTISVEMTSSESCVSMSTVSSTNIIMSVVTQLVASVGITATDTTICNGTTVTFTATPIVGGTVPVYQWKLNGANVGTNSPTFVSSTLVDSDTISVEMTSSESCVSISTVSSTDIIMSLVTQLVASVGITATDTTICNGTTVTFTAAPIVGGTAPVYQWKLNGMNVGTNSPTYISSTLVDLDTISVEMTSSVSCVSMSTVSSVSITMDVFPIPATPTVIQSDSITIESDVIGISYEWFLDGQMLSFNTQKMNPALEGYYQVIVSNGNCKSDSSAKFHFIWTGIDNPTRDLGIILYPNPNSGSFVIHSSTQLHHTHISIYNANGMLVYKKEIQDYNGNINVNLPKFGQGVYILELTSDQGVFTERFTIVR